MNIDPKTLWLFLPIGYAFTVLIETPILMLGMSKENSLKRRIFLGFALTAFTYPIVVLVLPLLVWQTQGERIYIVIAEIFAPVAECVLFSLAFPAKKVPWRDWGAIVLANLASFGLGEVDWVREQLQAVTSHLAYMLT